MNSMKYLPTIARTSSSFTLSYQEYFDRISSSVRILPSPRANPNRLAAHPQLQRRFQEPREPKRGIGGAGRASPTAKTATVDASSAHRFLHERADPCLFGGGQLLQREGGRPHGAFVEVRLVAEAERRVPRFELLRTLEEADDIAVLGVRGHPVPGFRREGWRAGTDDGMEPFGHGAIRFRHVGNLREHVAFPVRLLRARSAARFRLQLLGALLHRGSFLVRESLDRLAGHGGARGRLPCIRLWAQRASSY